MTKFITNAFLLIVLISWSLMASAAPLAEKPEKGKPPVNKGECIKVCVKYAETCSKECDHMDDDEDIADCKESCDIAFKGEKSYCSTSCEASPEFLLGCNAEEDEYNLTTDDCHFNCDEHYRRAVLTCHNDEKGKSQKDCYKSMNDLFSEEDGACKKACQIAPDSFRICTEF